MECPHISDKNCVKIDGLFVRKKVQNQNAASPETAVQRKDRSWKCLECASDKENWMCLNCGKILCGRYVNGHALKHSHFDDSLHKLCMNTLNQSVFCYKCDDFVINNTQQLDELRHELQVSAAGAASSEDEDQQREGRKADPDCSAIIGSNSVGATGADWSPVVLPPSPLGRRLRPRKRTISSDSNSHETGGGGSSSSSTTANKEVSSSSASSTTAPAAAKRAKSAAAKRVVGLRNLGNTCFMNSVLQSLSNIQEFSIYFHSLPSMDQLKQQRRSSKGTASSSLASAVNSNYVSSTWSSGSGVHNGGLSHKELEEANVVEELRKVLLSLGGQTGDGSKAISPECLFLVIWKVVPQFRGHRQHDAHEFLRYMLDRLHTELQQISVQLDGNRGKLSVSGGGTASGSSVAVSSSGQLVNGDSGSASSVNSNGYGGSKRSSIVTNVFGGVLQSEVRCLICGMVSKKHDPFLDLSLDIPEKFYSKEAAANGGDDEDQPACHISDCLFSFTEVEELAETELYYCSSCKCKQKSTKRFWIRRLPNVLCLHIKRFRWSNFFRTKIDLKISFPITALDMSQFVLNNAGPETRRSNLTNNIYDLVAVIVHHGNGSSCGHYTAYANNGGSWLHFNDHTVKEVPSSTVAECKPYILFYSRREPNSTKGTNG